MTPAVINVDLARGTDYDVVLLVQDAAACPLDLTGAALDISLKTGDAAVSLAVDFVDAAGGHVRVRVPGLDLGMYTWEGWLQLSPETPRERIIRGLVTVSDKVDPRADGNPSTHRYMVRISDAVTVTVDAVDLAWWAYEQTRLLLGVDYAALCADAARAARQSEAAAHTSSANAAAYATEAMRHRDAAGLSATGAATSERNAGTSAQAAADAARTASDAQEAAAEDARDLRRLLDGFDLSVGAVEACPYGAAPSVSIDPGPTAGSHVLNFVLVTGPQGDKGDPGTLASNAGDLDLGGHLTATGGTFSGTVTANGGVRVPLPATAQEALSYEALMEQQAAQDWRRMGYYMETLIPSWVTAMMRQMQISGVYSVATSNASVTEGVLENDLQDLLFTLTKTSGLSVCGCSTGAWKFANYLGNNRNLEYAAAVVWRILGSDNVSVLLGSTSQGYSTTTNPAADCYSHPIHWIDNQRDGADYRYPLVNAVNGLTAGDMTPAWQVTAYPQGYLGSSASCLIRGVHYGPTRGESHYIWALVPGITYLTVALAPAHPEIDGNVANRWELFINNNYVMPMTSIFWGAGNTAAITAKVKAHDVGGTYRVGLRMGGMRIDTAPALGVRDVWSIMERVAMDGATVKPVPEVTASVLEVPAEGGEVTLAVSSTLPEALYVLNDTMCGHDAAAVWCTQSTEEIPAGGGQVILTLAPNTTGKARQVWAFVGHHYAQASVVEINQLA